VFLQNKVDNKVQIDQVKEWKLIRYKMERRKPFSFSSDLNYNEEFYFFTIALFDSMSYASIIS
jgi:hypothetical protein